MSEPTPVPNDSCPSMTRHETRHECVERLQAEVARLRAENERLTAAKGFKEIAADRMAAAVDELVRRGALNARSLLADARLNYGEPFAEGETRVMLEHFRSDIKVSMGKRFKEEFDKLEAENTRLAAEAAAKDAALRISEEIAESAKFGNTLGFDYCCSVLKSIRSALASDAGSALLAERDALRAEVESLKAEIGRIEGTLLEACQEIERLSSGEPSRGRLAEGEG